MFVALPIYTNIPNLKGLCKIFFKLSCPKGNLSGGGMTVLNTKYPRLSSGDTNIINKPLIWRSNTFSSHIFEAFLIKTALFCFSSLPVDGYFIVDELKQLKTHDHFSESKSNFYKTTVSTAPHNLNFNRKLAPRNWEITITEFNLQGFDFCNNKCLTNVKFNFAFNMCQKALLMLQ